MPRKTLRKTSRTLTSSFWFQSTKMIKVAVKFTFLLLTITTVIPPCLTSAKKARKVDYYCNSTLNSSFLCKVGPLWSAPKMVSTASLWQVRIMKISRAKWCRSRYNKWRVKKNFSLRTRFRSHLLPANRLILYRWFSSPISHLSISSLR